jgi:hypothetical protein
MSGRILLDDPLAVGGSTQLLIGTIQDDRTGDPADIGGRKLKAWAAAVNTMTADLSAIELHSLTDAAPGTTVNDYAPTGYTALTSRMLVTAAAGGTTVNGLSATAVADNHRIYWRNQSTTDNTTFAHLAGGQTAGNQFSCPGGVAAILPPLTGAWLIYLVNIWCFA